MSVCPSLFEEEGGWGGGGSGGGEGGQEGGGQWGGRISQMDMMECLGAHSLCHRL